MARARLGGSAGAAKALVLAAAASCACSTDPSELLDVKLVVSDTIVRATDAVEVTVRATNVGLESVEVDPSGCPRVFRVMDSRAVVVGPEPILCALIQLAPRTLAPSDVIEFNYSWSGLGIEGARLAPGIYHLQAWARLASGQQSYSGLARVRVVEP